MVQPLWKTVWWFLEKTRTRVAISAILLFGIYLKIKRKLEFKKIHASQGTIAKRWNLSVH